MDCRWKGASAGQPPTYPILTNKNPGPTYMSRFLDFVFYLRAVNLVVI